MALPEETKDCGSYTDSAIVKKPITQSFFKSQIDTFFIKEHYDLGGATICIPKSRTLFFAGGSLSGGKLIFNNSYIQGNPRILTEVEGTIANETIGVDWFLDSNDVYQLFERGVYKLANHHVLSFSTREYVMSSLLNADHDLVLNDVVFDGNNCTITATDNKNTLHSMIPLDMSSDIIIRNMTLDGNASILKSNTEGSRHNIRIVRVNNLLIKNVVSKNAFTDGFCINGADNVVMNSCTSSHNGRQGLSITKCKDTKIRNCTFEGTYRTAPMSGVDIEPNNPQTDGVEVSFVNCRFVNNQACGFLVSFHEGKTRGATKRVLVDSCFISNNESGIVLQSAERSGKGSVTITNTIVENTKLVPLSTNWAKLNTPEVFVSNVTLHNGNLGDNRSARQLMTINANKRNTGNIYIDGIRIVQDPEYASLINYGIYLHSSNGKISDISLRNMDINLNRANSISNGVYDIRENALFGDNIQVEYENHSVMILSNPSHASRDKGLLSNYAIAKGVKLDMKASFNLDIHPSTVQFTIPDGSSITNVFSSKKRIKYSDGRNYSSSDIFSQDFRIERKKNNYIIHIL